MNVFNHYAAYYDLLYANKNYEAEVNYVDGLIRKFCPETKTILDMGCGTGTHGFYFARKNYEVTGIDLSANMVTIAKKKQAEMEVKNISFTQGNITSLRLNRQFDTVVSLFHVMNYLTSNKDMQSGFASASEHVRKGGIFIFDCWYGPSVLTDLPKEGKKEMENAHVAVTRNVNPVFHPNENTVDVNYEIIVKEKATGKTATIHETHSVRYFFKPEIELLLSQLGLELLACEEWITSKDPGFNTFGVCFVSRKK